MFPHWVQGSLCTAIMMTAPCFNCPRMKPWLAPAGAHIKRTTVLGHCESVSCALLLLTAPSEQVVVPGTICLWDAHAGRERETSEINLSFLRRKTKYKGKRTATFHVFCSGLHPKTKCTTSLSYHNSDGSQSCQAGSNHRISISAFWGRPTRGRVRCLSENCRELLRLVG